ncbi:hypothetical protein IAR55_001157 [Kwoniella newhampshirensis]|uniref:Uncharacterized protein n=1 Tax=Kwoniella newhampshirensis TaxID=1651941 RepID=A0AAW0Z4W6_9TREE
MMYTPTPAARRPRPPGSISRKKRAPLIVPDKQSHIRPMPSSVSRPYNSYKPRVEETPKSDACTRQRNELSKISASPADVSFGLDVEGTMTTPLEEDPSLSTSPVKSRGIGPIGLGLPSSLHLPGCSNTDTLTQAEPSPPPPYGQQLPHMDMPTVQPTPVTNPTHTPPRQDSGILSRRSSASPSEDAADQLQVEEHLRARRATDAARAIGLDVDFGLGQNLKVNVEEEMGSEEELDESAVRDRLREVKWLLKRRDSELLMAAEVAYRALRNHEQVVASLPSQVKARIPAHLVSLQIEASVRPLRDHIHNLSARRTSSKRKSPNLSRLEQPTYESQRGESYQLPQNEYFPPMADASNSESCFPRRFENALDSPVTLRSPELADQVSPPEQIHFASRSSDHVLGKSSDGSNPRPKLRSGLSSARLPKSSSPRYDRLSAIQAENEERIAILEEALAEALDGEDSQRKVVARLKKDVEKMQRELLRADERMAQTDESAPQLGQSVGIGWKRREVNGQKEQETNIMTRHPEVEPIEEEMDRVTENQRMGWGATAFPEFASAALLPSTSAGPSRPSMNSQFVNSRFAPPRTYSHDERQPLRNALPSRSHSAIALPIIPVDEMDSANISSSDDGLSHSPTLPRTRSSTFDAQKKQSRRLSISLGDIGQITSNDLLTPVEYSPASREKVSPRSPSLHIAIVEDSFNLKKGKSSRRSSTHRRSPWPSPRPSVKCPSPNARCTLEFDSRPHSRSPSRSLTASPGPAFASISSRMASMRAYVNQSLGGVLAGVGRTLESELGSEFGDDWNENLRSLDDIRWERKQVIGISSASSSDQEDTDSDSHYGLGQATNVTEDDDDGDDEEMDTSCVSSMTQPPLPLPPNVSAALSSLAIALAPSAVFSSTMNSSVSMLPRGSLREAGLDQTVDELLGEAAKMRKIRWAENARNMCEDRSTAPVPLVALHGQGRRSIPAPIEEKRLRGKVEQKLRPLRAGVKCWSAPEGRWDAGDCCEEMNLKVAEVIGDEKVVSMPQQSRKTMTFLGIRSGLLEKKEETPRKYALAHRRVRSICAQGVSGSRENGGDEPEARGKGKGKETSWTLDARIHSDHDVNEIHNDDHDNENEDDNEPIGEETHILVKRQPVLNTAKPKSLANKEPSTIPAKIVHDIFCLLAIFAEYLEWFVILVIRIGLDIRSGPRGELCV